MKQSNRFRIALGLLMVTVLFGLASPRASAQVPFFSLGAESSLNSAGKLTIVLPLGNGGSSEAFAVTISGATLTGQGQTASALPIHVGPLLPNQEVALTLTFAASANLVGTKQLLTVRGTYQSNGTSLGFAVNRFITIPNPLAGTDVFAIYGNNTDPGLLHAELAEGEIVDLYGTKDSLGHASAVQFARVLGKAGITQYWFDSQSRLQLIRFPSGMTWQFGWSSATETLVTATVGDGTLQFSSRLNFATGTSTPVPSASSIPTSASGTITRGTAGNFSSVQRSAATSQLSTNDTSGAASIMVRTCQQPEDNATVNVDVKWLLSSRDGLPAPNFGGGVYLAQIPSPSQSSQLDTSGKATALARAVSNVCQVYDNLQSGLTAVFGPGSSITVASFVCTALTTAAALYAPPAVPLVARACPLVFVGLKAICAVNGALPFVDKVIDTVNAQFKVTLHPVATLDATSETPPGAYFDFSPTGPFNPIPSIDFGCPPLNIGVQPSSLLLNVGDQPPLATTVKWDYNGSIYTSSTLHLQWSSMDSSIASVSPTDQTGRTAVVTGIKPGTTSILVKDATTGSESAPIPVTVGFKFPLTGQWAGTATIPNNQGGQETVQVSASFSSTSTPAGETVTGTVVFTGPGDVPTIYTITYTMASSTMSMTDVGSPDISVNGTVSATSNGLVVSASGNDGSSSGSGTVTFVSGGLSIMGNITMVSDPSSEFGTGSGTLQITPDGKHLTGTATGSDGSQLTWSADKQ
jgi:hypothetical protein